RRPGRIAHVLGKGVHYSQRPGEVKPAAPLLRSWVNDGSSETPRRELVRSRTRWLRVAARADIGVGAAWGGAARRGRRAVRRGADRRHAALSSCITAAAGDLPDGAAGLGGGFGDVVDRAATQPADRYAARRADCRRARPRR